MQTHTTQSMTTLMDSTGPVPTHDDITAEEVAQALKAFNEGRVGADEFFSPRKTEYHHPFFRVSNALVLRVMCAVLSLVCRTEYDVRSSAACNDTPRQRRNSRAGRRSVTPPGTPRRREEQVYLVEGVATYTPRLPFWRPSSKHFYTTVTLDNVVSAPGALRFTKLEPVRESYTMSLPARMITTPIVGVATAAAVMVSMFLSAASVAGGAVASAPLPPPQVDAYPTKPGMVPRLPLPQALPTTAGLAVSVFAVLMHGW